MGQPLQDDDDLMRVQVPGGDGRLGGWSKPATRPGGNLLGRVVGGYRDKLGAKLIERGFAAGSGDLAGMEAGYLAPGDGQHPGQEGGAALEGVVAAPRPERDLLKHVLGVLLPPRRTAAVPENLATRG